MVNLKRWVCLKYFNARATWRLLHSKLISFAFFLFCDHSLLSSHCLEFIPSDILLHILCTLYKSSVSALCQVIRHSHPNQRGSTQSELQILRCLSPLSIQWTWRVLYQSSHVTLWDTYSWILKHCLTYLYCPYLTAYTYFSSSASRYIPPLTYFITSRLGCLLFHCAIWPCWNIY